MRGLIATTAIALFCVATTHAQIQVIYSTLPNDPSSTIPNFSDGTPTNEIFESFDRPQRSSDSSRWIFLSINANASNNFDRNYVTGEGAFGVAQVQERITPVDGVRVFDSMTDRNVSIANNGNFLLSGGVDGDSNTDEVIIFGDVSGGGATVFSVIARENDPFISPVPAGATFDTSSFQPQFYGMNNDLIAFGFDGEDGGIPSDSDDFFFIDNGATIVLDAITEVPSNQLGGTTANMDDGFSFGVNMWISDDGVISYTGTLDTAAGATSSTDSVFVVNDRVEIQEGAALAGAPGLVALVGSTDSRIHPSGDWTGAARMDTAGPDGDNAGVALYNGRILAQSGDAIPGTGEVWSGDRWTSSSDTTFFAIRPNNLDEIVYGGFTDNVDGNLAGRWVIEGENWASAASPFVILSFGDVVEVDIDGDGTLDPAFIYESNLASASPRGRGGFMTDAGWYYSTVDLQDALGNDLGQAFIRVNALVGDTNCDGLINTGDIDPFVEALLDPAAYEVNFPNCSLLRADANGDNDINTTDIDPFVDLILGA